MKTLLIFIILFVLISCGSVFDCDSRGYEIWYSYNGNEYHRERFDRYKVVLHENSKQDFLWAIKLETDTINYKYYQCRPGWNDVYITMQGLHDAFILPYLDHEKISFIKSTATTRYLGI